VRPQRGPRSGSVPGRTPSALRSVPGPGATGRSRQVESAPGEPPCSTFSNGTCPSRTSYQSPLHSSPPGCCRAWSRLSWKVTMGWLGRRVADLQGALVVGAGAGQIAQVGGHGAGVAVPSGHVRVVGTVAVVWVSSRRHAVAQRRPRAVSRGLAAGPPGVARQVACYCCPLEGQQSAILRRRDAEARFREPRSSSSSQTADPTTCEATPQIGWPPRPEPSWGGRPRPGRDRLATRGRLSDARALCQDCGNDTCPSEFELIRRA
jgi:hypothetical protein